MKKYIEYEKAVEVLCDAIAPTQSESYIVSKCIDKLDNMPAADVREVVHAKWIRKEYNSDYPYYRMECSNCGGRMPRDQMAGEYYSDYCQSCGAKMDLV